jgi:nitroimidazol reductase NimA-like FMN-containing flavoprotein (pyridoxamine 5'-phosphate oxidase superfamily)
MPQKMLTEADVYQYLADNHTGRLATCDAEGQPYIVPLNYIYFNNCIYFHCAHEGKKLDNIKANPKVCFEVSQTDKTYFGDKACQCSTRYTSVIAAGTAQIVSETEEKVAVLNTITMKFANGRPYSVIDATLAATCTVVRIEIETVSGKKNVDPEH